jgi:hypothetical protein
MKSIYQPLVARFHGEIDDLDLLVKRISKAWDLAITSAADQDIFLDAVALNLHGFYSGIESLFLLVARHIDKNVPAGEHWHKQILLLMQEENKFRPAVIDEKDSEVLDELMRFRHVVRNVYAYNLIPERIESLVEGVDQNWVKIRAELKAFEKYLTKYFEEDSKNTTCI